MIDIVIVNYNSTNHLRSCLESIEKASNGYKGQIFIQDNASSDGIEMIKTAFPNVVLTKNLKNLGFAKAVNQGLKLASGDLIVLLNPDTRIPTDFFDISYKFMMDHPDVGIMGPRILNYDGSLQNSARSFPTPLTAFFGRTSFLSRKFPQNPITSKNLLSLKSDGKSPMEVDWISGACMVIRRKAIQDVGLFDERFFMYWEDADWCKRMKQSRWKVVYFPQACVYHYVGGSSEKALFRSAVEFHKSVYRLFDKHSKPLFSLLKPLVLGGLTVRLFFVLVSNLIQETFPIFKQQLGTPKPEETKPIRKIKILRAIARLNIGGPSIHVCILTNGLNPQQFESILVTGKISPQEGDMSYLFQQHSNKPIIIPELRRDIRIGLDIKAFFRIYHILSKEKPDIVDTHTAKAGTTTRLAVFFYNLIHRHHRIHLIHTFHGHVFEGYFDPINTFLFITIERYLAKLTDVIIALSQTQKQELAFKYRIAPPEKIHIINLGFDLNPFFACGALKGQFRKSLNLSDDSLLIGIIGRLVPIKNHKMFFDVAKLFLEKHPNQNVMFVVVGDGELRQELEVYCKKLDINDHVRFCGWIQDVTKVYADLDVLALTSLNEGTPVSIIESMAASVPVVATDAGGVKDLLGDVINYPTGDGFKLCARGIICDKNDVVGFVNGLEFFAFGHHKEKDICIQNAKNFVENHFDQKRLIREVEKLYCQVQQK